MDDMQNQQICTDSNSFFAKKWAFVLAITLTALLSALYYAGKGIDMTDAALQLYLQRNAFNGTGDTWMAVPLTNYVGGAWLSLVCIQSQLYWAYIGGAILYAVMFCFASLSYTLFFDKITWKDWLLGICIPLFLPWRLFVHYYSFPVCVAIIFFCCLLYALKSEKVSPGRWIMVGIMGGLVLFSRFTFITILGIPFCILAYHFFFCNDKKDSVQKFLSFLAGVIISVIPLLILFLLWKGQFPAGESEMTVTNIIYRLQSLTGSLMRVGIAFAIAVAVMVAVKIAELLFKNTKVQKVLGALLFAGFTFLSLALLAFFLYKGREWYFCYGVLPNYTFLLYIVPAIIFAAIILMILPSGKNGFKLDTKIETPFILFVLLFSLAVPLGSDVASGKLEFMAPIFLLLLGGLFLHRTTQDFPLRWYLFLSLILAGVIVRPLFTYLDAPAVYCSVSPRSPELKSMKTTASRAADWDELLDAFKQNAGDQKEVLMVGYLNFGPLFLCDKQDWNHGVCTGNNDFVKRFQKNVAQKELPETAFVDEDSKEFKEFEPELNRLYNKVYELNREYSHYSIWRKK